LELFKEPDSGERPVAFDRSWSDGEDGCDLFNGEAGEVAELDDASLAGVFLGEAAKGFVEGEDFFGAFVREGETFFEVDALEVTAAHLGFVGAGAVDEDTAHDVGGDTDEVFAILPVDVLFGEAEVGFVDEGGGLEGVVAALAAHVGGGDAMEFGVDEGE
jgi:hypothetical protein